MCPSGWDSGWGSDSGRACFLSLARRPEAQGQGVAGLVSPEASPRGLPTRHPTHGRLSAPSALQRRRSHENTVHLSGA